MTACQGAPAETVSPLVDAHALRVEQTPTPYDRVTIGPVSALVPDRWSPTAARGTGTHREGFVAAPDPETWELVSGRAEGMAAIWVDVADVGVASDLYYLAARPIVRRLVDADECRGTSHRVHVDHRPSPMGGGGDSPGDYVATGRGVCSSEEGPTRWAYFVAAPGYGPVRSVGIPSSGLYLVVAVVPDAPRAAKRLNRLLDGTTFAGAGMSDFIGVAAA